MPYVSDAPRAAYTRRGGPGAVVAAGVGAGRREEPAAGAPSQETRPARQATAAARATKGRRRRVRSAPGVRAAPGGAARWAGIRVHDTAQPLGRRPAGAPLRVMRRDVGPQRV